LPFSIADALTFSGAADAARLTPGLLRFGRPPSPVTFIVYFAAALLIFALISFER